MWLDKLHRVVDRETRVHAAARRVDVERDVLVGILGLQVQQLRDDNRAQASALAALQLRWLKVVESWESNGMPSTRSD